MGQRWGSIGRRCELMCGCSCAQVVTLPRTQLLAGERSFAGVDSLSSQDVLVLIQAAVPAIAGAYAAHADQGGPPTRGGVLSAFFRQWRTDNPGADVSEFVIRTRMTNQTTDTSSFHLCLAYWA